MANFILREPLTLTDGTGFDVDPNSEIRAESSPNTEITFEIPQAVGSSSNVEFNQISICVSINLYCGNTFLAFSSTSSSSRATTATTHASTATTQASNASTSAANALSYKDLALQYRDRAAAILTQTKSIAYNLVDSVSSHTAWGSITDGESADFADENSNTFLTMSEGSATYNYGSIT